MRTDSLPRKLTRAARAIADRNPAKLANALVALVELALVAAHVALESPTATIVLIVAGVAAPPVAGWIIARVTWSPVTVSALRAGHVATPVGELPLMPSRLELEAAAAERARVAEGRARRR